jgi:PAS domain S-box-containing protein
MRISTKLRIGYLFSAFIVIFAGVIIYISFKQMHITSINLKLVDTIQQGISELNIVGEEFLLYHEERPKIQWQIRHKALGRVLEEVNFHEPNNQSLLIEILGDLKLIGTVFSDLVSSHLTSSDNFESELLRQKQNRLKSRLLLKSQKVLSNATQLKNQMADELFSIQKYTNWISITLIMAATLLALLIEFLISRSITSPIKDLMRGTEAISSGNLEFRLDTDRRDEIGRLSRSFDQMINNLKTIMVSHDQLERRVEDRTAELGASNRQLNSEIEERKHAEENLKAAELRYRTVADFTYDWEYWSSIDGSLEYISPSCDRISGYSAQDFKENPALFREIIVHEDRKSWDTHALKSEKELKPGEIQFRILRKDGKIRWIEHLCQPVTDPQGALLGLRASNRDITARMQAELDAQRHRQELTHVSRIATLGELSASLAHELNQPLTAILSNAQAARRFLSGDLADPDEVNEILNDIIHDDKRAADMIKRLRALMRKKELEFILLDLNKVIRGVAELANREAFTKGVPLVLELVDGLPQVRGDAIHLEQVILNLILNGAEAMAGLDHQSRELRILTTKHDENAVRVSVRDMGTGIDEAYIASIFEAFYTTKPEGMGMGLSICRSIIEAHGGRLWAENNPDEGTTVSFTVPTYDKS